jgi:hypothetical protein
MYIITSIGINYILINVYYNSNRYIIIITVMKVVNNNLTCCILWMKWHLVVIMYIV